MDGSDIWDQIAAEEAAKIPDHCPECLAGPREPCTTASWTRVVPHVARLDLYVQRNGALTGEFG